VCDVSEYDREASIHRRRNKGNSCNELKHQSSSGYFIGTKTIRWSYPFTLPIKFTKHCKLSTATVCNP